MMAQLSVDTGKEEQEELEKEEKTMTDMVPCTHSAGDHNPRLDMFKVPITDLSMASRRLVKINPFNNGIYRVTFQVHL